MNFESPNVKQDFPILNQETVYLDSASSALTPRQVLDAEREFYETNYANVHRGNFAWSIAASEQFDRARKTVADHFHVRPQEVVFSSGATASLNMIAEAVCRNLTSQENIVVTTLEHHSNYLPWLEQAKRAGAEFRVVPVNEHGQLDMDVARQLVDENTKVFAFTAESNTLGCVLPVKELVELAHAHHALAVVDGAQRAAHAEMNLANFDVDFFVFSGHKMLGPTGTGGFFAKEEHLETFEPAHVGGGMIAELDDDPTWKRGTDKWEPGTQNLAGAMGLAAAITYMQNSGMDRVERHIKELTTYASDQLARIPKVTVYGKGDRGAIVSFNVNGIHPHDVAEILNQHNIAIRAGRHCAFPLMRTFNLSGMCRVSFHLYNTKEDVDALITAVKKAITVFETYE